MESRKLPGPLVDQVFASEDALGDTLWPLADHQQSAREFADYDAASDTTSIDTHVKFTAFGEIEAVEDGAGNPKALDPDLSAHLWTGRYRDPDTDLQ